MLTGGMPTASCYTADFEFKRTQEHDGIILLREDHSGRHAKNHFVYGCWEAGWEGRQYPDFGVGVAGEGYRKVSVERVRC